MPQPLSHNYCYQPGLREKNGYLCFAAEGGAPGTGEATPAEEEECMTGKKCVVYVAGKILGSFNSYSTEGRPRLLDVSAKPFPRVLQQQQTHACSIILHSRLLQTCKVLMPEIAPFRGQVYCPAGGCS